jgi:hypothetical protein
VFADLVKLFTTAEVRGAADDPHPAVAIIGRPERERRMESSA